VRRDQEAEDGRCVPSLRQRRPPQPRRGRAAARRSASVTPEALARATTDECFAECDPRRTGYVTAEAFRRFFDEELGFAEA